MLNFQGTVYIRNGITYSLPLIGGSIFLVNPGSVLIINQQKVFKLFKLFLTQIKNSHYVLNIIFCIQKIIFVVDLLYKKTYDYNW